MPAKISLTMIGRGSMLHDCVEIARRTPGVKIRKVLLKSKPGDASERLATLLRNRGIECTTYDDLASSAGILFDGLGTQDLLVSVYNEDRLEQELLSHFCYAINFHDSPLPRYAGSNAVSWALLSGETTHGATWHLVTSRFDGGDIVAQELFPVASDWVALDLALKSIEVGRRLFASILDSVMHGTLTFKKQDLQQRTYFRRTIVPFAGRFPFLATADVLERLRRATGYFPGQNRFCAPAVTITDTTTIQLGRYTVQATTPNSEPGTIVAIDATGISFAAANAVVKVDVLRGPAGTYIRAGHPGFAGTLVTGSRAVIDYASYNSMGLSADDGLFGRTVCAGQVLSSPARG